MFAPRVLVNADTLDINEFQRHNSSQTRSFLVRFPLRAAAGDDLAALARDIPPP
jgi:hypothetical protein